MRSMRMLIWSVLKVAVFPEEKTGKKQEKSRTKENGGDNSTRAGHVTPSFLTDDEEELQSNIDLVSLV